MNLIITPSQWALNSFLIRINWVYFRVHFNYSIKCQNLLHLAKYTVWLKTYKKKLHKPIRMQTASIKTLKTNFRSMTTSKEIQTTFQANWAPSTPTLRTLDHPEEVQVTVIYDLTSGKSESWKMSTNDSKLHDRCIFCKIANLQDSKTRILYQVTNNEFELHDYIYTL